MPPRGFGRRIIRGTRIFRGPRIIRHILRPYPRRIFRLTRRLLFGTWVYLLITGSNRPYKLYPEEVERIETHSGKAAEDMTEEELSSSMRDLNIENREVSDFEYSKIDEMNGKSTSDAKTAAFCRYCGAKLDGPNVKFCSNCGSKNN